MDSQWISVCYDGWDELDTKVVCREMNYLYTSVEIKGISTKLSMLLLEVKYIIITMHLIEYAQTYTVMTKFIINR